MQYFPIFQYKLHLFNIREDQSTRGLLAKPPGGGLPYETDGDARRLA